jgi:archaemetzincin
MGGTSQSDAASEPIPCRLPAEFEPLRAQAERLRPLHQKKKPIQPGDWLERNPEGGQTFACYVQARGGVPLREEAAAIYLQPLGEFDDVQRRIIDQTAEFLGVYFGVPVTTREARPLGDAPGTALRWSDEGEPRFATDWLMNEHLLPQRPDDAIAVIGLVTHDLWNADHGWVFGAASMADRVGVWSLHRNGDPRAGSAAYRLCLRRTLKTAVHETGHMLGIPHCAAWECAMNGSRSREENDGQPLEYCPECQPKIWWSCGVEPVQRCRGLLDFAEREGLMVEAELWRQELNQLSAATGK